MQKLKVLIVDDHRLIREGLRSLLELENDQYSLLIEEAETSEAAMAKVKKSNFDLVLMDYQLPKLNGAETTRAILASKPEIRVLALSNYNEKTYISNILQAGAKGYILKDIDADELIKAITTIVNGENYFSSEVALTLMNAKNDSLKTKKTPSGKKLCEREFEILKLIAKAYTSREIAGKLFLSKHTIDKYRNRLLKKMQVNNTVNLLTQARQLNLIE